MPSAVWSSITFTPTCYTGKSSVSSNPRTSEMSKLLTIALLGLTARGLRFFPFLVSSRGVSSSLFFRRIRRSSEVGVSDLHCSVLSVARIARWRKCLPCHRVGAPKVALTINPCSMDAFVPINQLSPYLRLGKQRSFCLGRNR
jgi:hypothetical protein